MTQSKGYLNPEYLKALGDFVRSVKERSYARMRVQPGHAVLDVGCGPGTDTLPLASLVGATGRVTGVDHDAAMIREANRCVASAGVETRVEHRQADVVALPFEASSFDSSRSERLFQHVLEPERALSEMSRVTKPGGWVVVLDTDWNTLSIDTPERNIERQLARIRVERTLNNASSGRQLPRLFKRQGLADVTIDLFPLLSSSYAFVRQASFLDETERDASASGAITSEELARWHSSLEQADAEGLFFATTTLVMVAGRKP